MLCPICRLDISEMEIDKLLSAPEPLLSKQDTSNVVITPELRKLQKQMDKLFIKQLEAGGIIDKEAEEKRFLIVTTIPTENSGSSSGSSNNEIKKEESVCNAVESTNSVKRQNTNITRERPEVNLRFSGRKVKSKNNAPSSSRRDKNPLHTMPQETNDKALHIPLSSEIRNNEILNQNKTKTYGSDSCRGGRGRGRKYKPRTS